MIIVEGPDGVGKTTLCKKLLAVLPGYIYAHFTRLPQGFDYYWGYADRVSRQVVQDRFHMSEVAYAAARGDPCGLDRYGYALVDARLRLAGAYTILVTADDDLVAARWDQSQMYDLDRTLVTSRVFTDIAAGRHPVPMDVDLNIHCTAGSPYATNHDIHRATEEYLFRQARVSALATRRPARL